MPRVAPPTKVVHTGKLRWRFYDDGPRVGQTSINSLVAEVVTDWSDPPRVRITIEVLAGKKID